MLGVLQRRAMDEQSLSSFVVQCEGHHLQKRALDVCTWAIEHSPTAAQKTLNFS